VAVKPLFIAGWGRVPTQREPEQALEAQPAPDPFSIAVGEDANQPKSRAAIDSKNQEAMRIGPEADNQTKMISKHVLLVSHFLSGTRVIAMKKC